MRWGSQLCTQSVLSFCFNVLIWRLLFIVIRGSCSQWRGWTWWASRMKCKTSREKSNSWKTWSIPTLSDTSAHVWVFVALCYVSPLCYVLRYCIAWSRIEQDEIVCRSIMVYTLRQLVSAVYRSAASFTSTHSFKSERFADDCWSH